VRDLTKVDRDVRTLLSKRISPAILLVFLLLLRGPTLASGAELFQPLEGREFQGRSIVGAHGTHPVRHPADLQLFFDTAELSGYGDATPTLYWRSRCNGHDYILTFVHQRLHTSAQVSTKKRCTGQSHREERWLEDFFAVDLTWSLRHGRLTLTSGQRQIVLVGNWLLSPSR
jgi:heat shock protein HslJ